MFAILTFVIWIRMSKTLLLVKNVKATQYLSFLWCVTIFQHKKNNFLFNDEKFLVLIKDAKKICLLTMFN